MVPRGWVSASFFSARERLRDINPDVQIDGCGEPFTSENALRIEVPSMIKNLRVGTEHGSDPIDILIFQDDRLGATQIPTNNLIKTYPVGSPQGLV